MNRNFRIIVFILVFVFQNGIIRAQDAKVTVDANQKPLNLVLETLTGNSGIKFAFDADVFRKIEITCRLENVTLETFLDFLLKNYSIRNKQIGTTWVLSYDKKVRNYLPDQKPENFEINGYVGDSKTGEKLIYTAISTQDGRGAITNENGFFILKVPAADSVKILVSFIGYQTFDTIVSLPQKKPLQLYLKPLQIELSEIKVQVEEKNVLDASSQPEKVSLSPAEAKTIPRLMESDLLNSLTLIPGVNFSGGISGGLSIRGGAPADNLLLLDGIPVLETGHLFGSLSVLNASFIRQAFVSRGGFDAKYGGRVAGLIELSGKSPVGGSPYLEVAGNLMNSNVSGCLPIGKSLTISAAWRRSYIDQWQNYLTRDLLSINSDLGGQNDMLVFPTVRFQDLNAKIEYHPNHKNTVNVNLIYSDDWQNKEFELQKNELYRNENSDSYNYGASFNWKYQAGDKVAFFLTGGYSSLERNSIDESGTFKPTPDNNGQGKGKSKPKNPKATDKNKISYELNNGFNTIEEFRLQFNSEFQTGSVSNQIGFGYTEDVFSYRYIVDQSLSKIPVDSVNRKANLGISNFFAQQSAELGRKLTIRWGIRGNTDLSFRKLYWEPRAGIQFLPAENMELYLSGGRYYQFLSQIKRIDNENNFSQVWFVPDSTGWGTLDAYHLILGGKYEFDGFLISAEGYLKKVDGRANLFATEYKKGNVSRIDYRLREGNERYRGIDFFMQYHRRNWEQITAYSVSVSEEQWSSDKEFIPSPTDRRHRLMLTGIYKLKNWKFAGSWQFLSGLPVYETSNDQIVYTGNRSDFYSEVDFSVYKIIPAKHFVAEAGVSLMNILDRQNIIDVETLRFSTDTGVSSFRSGINSIGFMPLFYINFRFQ